MPPDERVDAVDGIDRHGRPSQRGHVVVVDGIAAERDQGAARREPAGAVVGEGHAAGRLNHGEWCADHGVAIEVHPEGSFGGVVLG